MQHLLAAIHGDQKADHAGETGGAVILPGDPNPDPGGEQQAEIGEHRLGGGQHEGDVQHVGLAAAQQQAGHR